jgi:hypothetical protein
MHRKRKHETTETQRKIAILFRSGLQNLILFYVATQDQKHVPLNTNGATKV